MIGIRQWAAGLCFAAAATGFCGMIAPQKGIGKTFRLVMILFFLTSLVYPLGLKGLSKEIFFNHLEQAKTLSQEIEMEADAAISHETKRQMAQKVFALLKEEGIIPARLCIDMSDQENKVLLKIWLSDRLGQEEKIRQLLESEQLEVIIACEEGENFHGG